MYSVQISFSFILFAAIAAVIGLKFLAPHWVDAKIVSFKHASLLAAAAVVIISTVMAQPTIIDLIMVPLEIVALMILRWIARVEGRGSRARA